MNKRRHNGFSLIEVLVAAGLLAGATVTVCALGVRSLDAMQVCQGYEKAWDVLDRQMVLLEQIGMANLVDQPTLSGVIEDPQSQTQWKWQASVAFLDVEKLYALTMTVEWVSEGKVRRIQCDTRLRAAEEIESTSSSTSVSTPTSTTQSQSN
jgi:prepilin-type N-terminal cleavage/methylation domain-containing protein